MSCLSLFLEVFGHIFISMISGLGYVVYTMQKKYMLVIIGLVLVSDIVRDKVNAYKGKFWKRPFAKYIAPRMFVEGVLSGMAVSVILAYLLSYTTFLPISSEEYLIFGQMIGFLSLIGNLLTEFFKRCANIDDKL